jgi:hypothetical protein
MNRLHKIDAELTALLEAIAKREEWTEGDIARRLRSTIDAWRSFQGRQGQRFHAGEGPRASEGVQWTLNGRHPKSGPINSGCR